MDGSSPWEGGASFLSFDEVARAGRYHREVDRRRWKWGRGQLRRILGAYLSAPAESIFFRYSEEGKPELDADGSLGFSVSHSEKFLLVGIGTRPLGVDVEVVRPVPDLEAVGALAFTEQEMKGLDAEVPGRKLETLLRLWTAKEALMKGLGTGFLADPRGVELRQTPFGFRAVPGRGRGVEWSVVSFSIASGEAGGSALGAVAVPGPPPELRWFPIPGEGRTPRTSSAPANRCGSEPRGARSSVERGIPV